MPIQGINLASCFLKRLVDSRNRAYEIIIYIKEAFSSKLHNFETFVTIFLHLTPN